MNALKSTLETLKRQQMDMAVDAHTLSAQGPLEAALADGMVRRWRETAIHNLLLSGARDSETAEALLGDPPAVGGEDWLERLRRLDGGSREVA